MSTTIQASVGIAAGRHCHNLVSDQAAVIDLLNSISARRGGRIDNKIPSAPLRQGFCSAALHRAILGFQAVNSKEFGLSVDGHVDPGQKTLAALNRIVSFNKIGGVDVSEIGFPISDPPFLSEVTFEPRATSLFLSDYRIQNLSDVTFSLTPPAKAGAVNFQIRGRGETWDVIVPAVGVGVGLSGNKFKGISEPLEKLLNSGKKLGNSRQFFKVLLKAVGASFGGEFFGRIFLNPLGRPFASMLSAESPSPQEFARQSTVVSKGETGVFLAGAEVEFVAFGVPFAAGLPGPVSVPALILEAHITKRLPTATAFAFFSKGTIAGASVVGASVHVVTGPTILRRVA